MIKNKSLNKTARHKIFSKLSPKIKNPASKCMRRMKTKSV